MLVSTTFPIYIYFGNATHAVNRDEIMRFYQNQLEGYDHLNSIRKFLLVDHLVLLDYLFFGVKQHGAMRKSIIHPLDIPSVVVDSGGDCLMTMQKGIGLAVLTADCLPIILYDSEHHACAIVHAGYKSSIEQIVVKALDKMAEIYDTKAVYVHAFFGPCAKVCCYKVQGDVLKEMQSSPFKEQVFQQKADNVFFNFPFLNQLQLQAAGVKKEHIHFEHLICTIENSSFCSYRRDGNLQRQVSVVVLR